MPRKSKIYDLPGELREAINALINGGVTYTAIVDHLKGLGVEDVSRSSVGRYGLEQKKIAEDAHRMRLLAESFVSGAAGKSQGGMVQGAAEMVGGLLLKIYQKAFTGESLELSVVDVRDMARASESIAKAQKLAQNMDIDAAKQKAEHDAEKADLVAGGATIQIEFVEPAPLPAPKKGKGKPAAPADNAADAPAKAAKRTPAKKAQKGPQKVAVKAENPCAAKEKPGGKG